MASHTLDIFQKTYNQRSSLCCVEMGEMQNEAELVVVTRRTWRLWHRTPGQGLVPFWDAPGRDKRCSAPWFLMCVLPIASILCCLFL